MGADIGRRLVAEVLGTTLLVLFGAGAVVGSFVLEGAITYAGLGFVGLSFAIAIAIAIYAFGPVSGAHINPAVTLALAVTRRFSWVEVLPYIFAQLVGGAIGALLIVVYVGSDAAELGAVGATTLGEGVNVGQGLVAEAVGTFLLLTAIMALAVDPRAPHGWAGLGIGLAVASAIFVVGPVTGASLNPARTLGPYLANSIIGGDTPWSEFWLYCVGPIVGAVLAALAYAWIVRPPPAAAPEPAPELRAKVRDQESERRQR